MDAKAKALALQESIRARLEALKRKSPPVQTPSSTAPTMLKTPPVSSVSQLPPAKLPPQVAPLLVPNMSSLSTPQVTAASAAAATSVVQSFSTRPEKRAKRYDLDLSVTAPTFQQKAAPKVNPYLAHRLEEQQQHSLEDSKGETDKNDAAVAKVDHDSHDMANQPHDEFMDDRLIRAAKPRDRHKALSFVEPGKYVELAERKRQKAIQAELAGFVSGRKAGTYVTSATMADIYGGGGGRVEDEVHVDWLAPRADTTSTETVMPLIMEWWDIELLPSKLKKQVAAVEGTQLSKQSKAQMQQLLAASDAKKAAEGEGSAGVDGGSGNTGQSIEEELQALCWTQASLRYSKTAALIQHIIPVKPPNASDEPPSQPVLNLTQKERKRQRKLRRAEKQRELQDLQAAGLIAPPEPRLTLKNFIRVLGDQAILDPSQTEQKVTEQIQARQRAHMARNEANRLTKEQRAAKRAKKLQEDTSATGVRVALFLVQDMSHPYHRTKVDLNAQQLNITGGVLECRSPALACVICEGGPKAIKRYKRLMLVRMKWTGPDGGNDDDDEEDEVEMDDAAHVGEDGKPKVHKFNSKNKCELVWEGMAVRRLFSSFVFQACDTSDQARKVLKAKGVGHYWDHVLTHASGRGDSFRFKLAESDDDDDGDDESDDERDHGDEKNPAEQDVVMEES
jgi:U4/U6 small nuclear ribonucleoprotein PRP3